MSTLMPDVKVNQVWKVNDPRLEGRTLRVEELYEFRGIRYARCSVLALGKSCYPAMLGKNVRIKVARFRPIKSGYTLIQEAPAPGGTS